MYNSTQTPNSISMEKWSPILDHEGGIQDAHKRAVTAQLLENQEVALSEERAFLSETPTVNTQTPTLALVQVTPVSPVTPPLLVSLLLVSTPF